MPDSYNTRLDDFVHRVPISSLLLDPGSTCAVYGCYEEDTVDTIFEYFLIQNRTCQYTGISDYYKDSTIGKRISPLYRSANTRDEYNSLNTRGHN